MQSTSCSEVSRREFLAATGVAGVALGLGLARVAQSAPGAKIPIGLELY